MMWFLLLLLHLAHIELVISQAEDKLILKNGNKGGYPCEGYLEVYHNNTWGYVGDTHWDKNTEKVVCKSTHCGEPVDSSVTDIDKPSEDRPIWLNELKCEGDESALWECKHPGWKSSYYSKLTVKKITCSSNITISLDGPKCAGAVKYSIDGKFDGYFCNSNIDSVEVKLADGPGRCAGRLEIKHEGQWRNVPANRWTEAQSAAVCKQLECGEKGKTEKFSQGSGSFLSITCPTNKKISNISECLTENSNNQRPDREVEAVGITCEGHKVVFLSGTCSGHVGIEHGREIYWLSGSKETWNQESADTVCQQMHCGNAASFSFHSRADMINKVWKDSFSCSSRKKSLSECSQTTLLPPDHQTSTALVKCSGNIEMRLTNSCWGKVRIRVEGKEGDMCADTWTEDKSVKLCEKLNCGTPIKAHNSPRDGDIIIKSLHPTSQTTDLTQSIFVKNQDNDNSCKQKPAYVVCSGSVKPRFSIPSYKCFGNIEVEYEGKWIPVCEDALKDTNNRNTICQELKCGDAVETLLYFGPAPTDKLAISNLNCTANANSPLSACSSITASTAACKHSGLRCSEEPSVSLSQNCSGEVRIDGVPVCASNWDLSYAHKVCQEKLCGNAVFIKPKAPSKGSGNIYHVSCEKYHSIIGQCRRTKGKCDTNVVFITCSESVKFRTTEKHGGVLEVNYRDKWERVCPFNPSPVLVRKLCEVIKKENHSISKEDKQVNLETTLEFTDVTMDVKHSVKQRSCGNASPAEILCEDYEKHPSISIAPIIVGVRLLVVVILTFVFVRFCVKRARRSRASSRMLPGKELEFQGGEHEDVTDKENEMEDFSCGGVRSEAELISEKDDIQADEARPLTFPGTTAININTHKDGVTYQVENPVESFDDIDTIPGTTLTTAEVHVSHT
ncbi:unnamed protein product [Oreochromis niloticus]|nr:unnamed protein product [Mustela putorius furo]